MRNLMQQHLQYFHLFRANFSFCARLIPFAGARIGNEVSEDACFEADQLGARLHGLCSRSSMGHHCSSNLV